MKKLFNQFISLFFSLFIMCCSMLLQSVLACDDYCDDKNQELGCALSRAHVKLIDVLEVEYSKPGSYDKTLSGETHWILGSWNQSGIPVNKIVAEKPWTATVENITKIKLDLSRLKDESFSMDESTKAEIENYSKCLTLLQNDKEVKILRCNKHQQQVQKFTPSETPYLYFSTRKIMVSAGVVVSFFLFAKVNNNFGLFLLNNSPSTVGDVLIKILEF